MDEKKQLDLRVEIAKRIADLGLTQQEVAGRCGISQPHIQGIVSLRRSANAATLSRIIAALGGEIRWREAARSEK